MKIYVSFDLEPADRPRIDAAADDVIYGPGSGEVPAALREAEVVFGNIAPDWLARATALRWMQLESVGFGQYPDVLAGEVGKRVTVTNLAGFFDDPVAESVLAGLLALLRGIDRSVLLKEAVEWEGDAMRPGFGLLTGARVVIFGHGAIGRRLGAMLGPFGCTLDTFGSDWDAAALDAALEVADIVVAIAPHTPRTAGVFDAARIGRMKPGALFANAGRGSLVDETAMAAALESGRLGGAVLDVTVEEPLPADHPFWRTPRLILTQHSAGGFRAERRKKVDVFLANLARYRAGEPLVGIIDIARGY